MEKDPDAEIVAGIDIADQGKNSYPVFTDIDACQVEADAIIDFSSAKATDKLLEYSAARQIPVVLCSTGLSQEQLAKVEETSRKVAVLKSANMSLGINTLLKLVQDAARVLAAAGFDMEIVEKHHRLKLDAPSVLHLRWQTALMRLWITSIIMYMTAARNVKNAMIRRSVSPQFAAELS